MYNENILDWLATIGIGFMIMILIPTNIVLLRKLCTTSDNKKSKLTIFSFCAIISFTLAVIIWFIACILILITHDKGPPSTTSYFACAIGILLYFIGQTVMIFTFTLRIDLTLKGTDLAYSKCVLRLLYISCAVLSITLFLAIICVLFVGLYIIMYPVAIAWILLYFILSILLIILFLRKIESLLVSMKTKSKPPISTTNINHNKTPQSDSSDTNIDIIKSIVDDNLFYILIKHGVLVPFAIFSSFLCWILDLVIIYTIGEIGVYPTATFWFALDCTISSLCIFLLFGINKDIYDKVCYPLHHLCKKCELSKITRSHTIVD